MLELLVINGVTDTGWFSFQRNYMLGSWYNGNVHP